MAGLTTIVSMKIGSLDNICTTLKTFFPNGQTCSHLRKRVAKQQVLMYPGIFIVELTNTKKSTLSLIFEKYYSLFF